MGRLVRVLPVALVFTLALLFGSLTTHRPLPALAVAPGNDDFADAATITTLPFTDSVDSTDATTEPGEPTLCERFGLGVGSTVWYRLTPDADTVVLADTAGSDFDTVLAVWVGNASLDGLMRVACNDDFGSLQSKIAFAASAGQSYYFQVGGLSFDSGFSSSGNLLFNLDTFAIPSCPATQFSLEDPVGDTGGFDGSQADVVSVSGGSDADNFCLTVEFAGPVDPPDAGADQAVTAIIDFDTDGNPDTGLPSEIDFACPDPSGLGVEAEVLMFGGSGLIAPIFQFSDGLLLPQLEGDNFATLLFDETSFTIVAPLAALGGDDSFKLAMFVGPAPFEPSDCVPNGGFIRSVPAFGDVDCDGDVDIGDAQKVARSLVDLPVAQGEECPPIAGEVASLFGDVDCDGDVDIGDAQKIARSLIDLDVTQEEGCPPIG